MPRCRHRDSRRDKSTDALGRRGRLALDLPRGEALMMEPESVRLRNCAIVGELEFELCHVSPDSLSAHCAGLSASGSTKRAVRVPRREPPTPDRIAGLLLQNGITRHEPTGLADLQNPFHAERQARERATFNDDRPPSGEGQRGRSKQFPAFMLHSRQPSPIEVPLCRRRVGSAEHRRTAASGPWWPPSCYISR